MDSKPSSIDEFGSVVRRKLRKYWPIRTVGQSMIVIALLGIIFAALPSQMPSQARLSGVGPRVIKLNKVGHEGPSLEDSGEQYLKAWRLTIEGNAKIDEGIVKTAKPIDEKMIHQYADSRGALIAPSKPGRKLPLDQVQPRNHANPNQPLEPAKLNPPR